jgi:molybdopterin-guanine dinucleotide biosynthesis protein A
VIGALLTSGGRVLTETETRSLPGFFDDCFMNVNTPEELARAESVALTLWKGGE